MRIAIDARWIGPEASGIATYTRALIEALVRLENEHEFLLLFERPEIRARLVRDLRLDDAPRVETVVVPYGPFSARSQLHLPRLLRRRDVDVFHSTNFMMPLLPTLGSDASMRYVVTIHDLIPLLFPEAAPESRKTRFFALYVGILRWVARRADCVLTDSEASRRDILARLAVPADARDKVRAIHCGVGAEFTPGPPPSDRVDRERTILHVGRPDPHKNLGVLLRAFAAARPRLPFPVRLVLVGPRGAEPSDEAELVRELELSDAVHRRGNVEAEDLLRAYREADALCLPSLYEGFGLPAVEAMASGVPVVCSNAGSLPEVVGDAAIVVAPSDVDGLAAALVRVLTDEPLRRELTARGLERARTFSWERTASETMAIYEDLAEEDG